MYSNRYFIIKPFQDINFIFLFTPTGFLYLKVIGIIGILFSKAVLNNPDLNFLGIPSLVGSPSGNTKKTRRKIYHHNFINLNKMNRYKFINENNKVMKIGINILDLFLYFKYNHHFLKLIKLTDQNLFYLYLKMSDYKLSYFLILNIMKEKLKESILKQNIHLKLRGFPIK